MNSSEILSIAKIELMSMQHHIIDVLDITQPKDIEYAKQLAKVVSKLSPLI